MLFASVIFILEGNNKTFAKICILTADKKAILRSRNTFQEYSRSLRCI